MDEIGEIREIPIADLVVSKGQVRLRDVGKEIDELADSIRKLGLLEPIVVSPSGKPGKYEILTGQRRVLAHRQLQRDMILARVLPREVDEVHAKAISLTENLVRRDLTRNDLIDACTSLFKRYGTVKAVVEETGLPYEKVRLYVKYDRLTPELRKLVDAGLDMNTALRATDAATDAAGELNVEEAVALAKEMSTMSGSQISQIVKQREEDPEAPLAQVIEEAKSGEEITSMAIQIGTGLKRALTEYAKADGYKPSDAALNLIEEGLSAKGFLVE